MQVRSEIDMVYQDIFCGEVRSRPPRDEGGTVCPFCGKKAASLGEFNGYRVTQPVAPNTDLLLGLGNFEGKRVLVVITEVLSDEGEIPKETIQEAVKDARSCLTWYSGLVKSGKFRWFNPGGEG
jgi:hypothetical protein